MCCLPLDLPVAKTHTVYRTLGDLHDMLRHRHEAIARVGGQMLPFLPCPLHVLDAWCCVVVRATPQRGRGVQADIGGRDAFGDSLPDRITGEPGLLVGQYGLRHQPASHHSLVDEDHGTEPVP